MEELECLGFNEELVILGLTETWWTGENQCDTLILDTSSTERIGKNGLGVVLLCILKRTVNLIKEKVRDLN